MWAYHFCYYFTCIIIIHFTKWKKRQGLRRLQKQQNDRSRAKLSRKINISPKKNINTTIKKRSIGKIQITSMQKLREQQKITIQKESIKKNLLIQEWQIIIQIKITISNNLKRAIIKKKAENRRGRDKSSINKLK